MEFSTANVQLSLCCLLSVIGLCIADLEIIYGRTGSSIIFICPYKRTSTNSVSWDFVNNTFVPIPISDGTYILPLSSPHPRANVVGDHTAGVYNLNMSELQHSDEGVYRCSVLSQQKEYKLEFLAAPYFLTLQDATDNKILGTEGQSLTLKCTAAGGKPPPLVTITVDNVPRYDVQSVEYNVTNLQRRHDKQIVQCIANSSALLSPLVSSAALYIRLKPLQPIFNPDPVTTEETRPLLVSCTSTGSRPAATFQWTLGLANITSYAITQATNTGDDIYTVTSTLTYAVDRTYNGLTISCTAVNVAATNGISKAIDVTFAPDIIVTNETYDQNTATRTVTCNPDGNPTKYAYYRWKHKSTYGVLIRELDAGQTLTLPNVPEDDRYQDSGEYICAASNGIVGRDGMIHQTGSGYVTVKAKPVLISDSDHTEYGEFGKDVDIHVYVYSVPKYRSVRWYKSNVQLSVTGKYNFSEFATPLTVTFHGTMVQLDGYRITLTIKNLVESDFNVSYNAELSNGVGQPVVYATLLVSASPPQTPINFTVIISSEASVVFMWEAGYNGGNEQAFYIEYRKLGSHIWIGVKIQDTKQTGTQTYKLTGLQEETLYELRMYAENRFNKSLPTKTETIGTIRGCKLSSSEAVNGGVAGGLSAVIVIMLIIIIILILQKQRIGKNGSMTHNSRWKDKTSYHNSIDCKELDEQKDTLNENNEICHVCPRSTQEYETLGMKDAPNTYSQLLKEQDKHISKSVQEYETLGMADNPSTYSDLHEKQGQNQSESTADYYESLSNQDKVTVYENTNVKKGQTQKKYRNVKA